MNTWGNSWGGSWGESWGADEVPAPELPTFTGGPDAPRRRTDYRDDELFELAIALIMSGALDG